MQSIVEVVCVGGGSNKTYNSVYTDPGYCKMVIVQDDDKFPSPRLCLLRRWPNFEGGFGFNLYEDLISSTGALKVEEVVRHSPAEAGGLRRNDVIIEINGDNIEFKSFFRLVEILKEACSQNEMELLVLAEHDAEWYRVRNICVNSNFPNIEYCETPYYGHILKPLESLSQVNIGTNGPQPKVGTSQIEFHSSTGKLYRTTLVIDKEKDSVYRRIEELPSSSSNTVTQSADQLAQQSMAPLRPDGSYRHPSNDTSSVRVYYRRDREFLTNNNPILTNNIKTGAAGTTGQSTDEYQTIVDSGHGSISNRRSTPLSTTTGVNMNTASMSPYSTLGKSYGEQAAVDLLHDKWADLMDKYLDNKFRSSSSASGTNQGNNQDDTQPDRDTSAGGTKRNYTIRLNDPNATLQSKRSRCQSPNDGSFSYLYSGRDDYQTASATSFRDLNHRQTSPYQHLVQHQRGSSQTQSNRYPSPLQSVTSPTRSTSRHHPNRNNALNINNSNAGSNLGQSETATSSSSSPLFQQYESSSFSTHSTSNSIHQKVISDDSGMTLSRGPHNIILRPKAISHSLGFQLDENEVLAKGYYFVKYVDPNSASAQAGLKEGDKITKINGKSTGGMSYDEFCNEIAIAQQQQLKNNMIHLMVMRRSAKTSSTGSSSSVSANALSSISGSGSVAGPTVLPIKNNMYMAEKHRQKPSSIITSSTSSNLVDEGYVPGSMGSATSSSHTATIGDASTSNLPYNLVSVVRVTSPTSRSEIQQVPVSNKQPPTKPAHTIASEVPAYLTYESKVHYRPNVIYDNQETHITEVSVNEYPNYEQSFTYDENSIPEIPKSSPPDSPNLNQIKYQQQQQQQQQQQEREKQDREQEQKERQQREQKEREKERLEKEKREKEQQQLELEKKNAEVRERELKERERQKELEKRKSYHRASEQAPVQSVSAAFTTIITGSESIQTLSNSEINEKPEQPFEKIEKEQQKQVEQSRPQQALAALTAITALGSEPIQSYQQKVDLSEKPEQIKVVTPESVILDKYRQKPVDTSSESSKIIAVGQEPISATSVILNAVQPEKQKETSSDNVTISIIGTEPIKSTTTTLKPEEQQINITLDKTQKKPVPQKYPAIIDETNIYTTTKITKSVSEVHELRSEVIEQRDPTSGQVNKNVFETEIISTSTHLPEDERVTKDYNQNIHQLHIQRDDEDNLSETSDNQEAMNLARQQYSENNKRDRSLKYKLHQLPITDDLKHIVDEKADLDSSLNDNNLSSDTNNSLLHQPSLTDFDESQFIKKLFIFKKYSADAEGKQPSLAQIIKNLNKDPNSEDQQETENQSSGPAYAPPYPIGIRLKTKTNQLEIGNHIISTVEPNSPADLAGLKVNSRLHKLNDVTCDDKTHEFVLFYLNYILRKNTCHSIEMIVDEPFYAPKPIRSSLSFRDRHQIDNEKSELLSNTTLVDPSFDQTSSHSTINLQGTEEPSKIHSALAALTKIVGIGADEEIADENIPNAQILSSNDLVHSENLMTDNLEKSSNENLKSIIQSIIWRPPFHKSDGSLFHSDSFESNLSNTNLSISQDDESHSNLKGIFKDVLYHNTNESKSTSSMDQEQHPSDRDKFNQESVDFYSQQPHELSSNKIASIVPGIIESHKAPESTSVTSHSVQKGEQQFHSNVDMATTSISSSGIHSAFAALTKITSLGATTEEKTATVSSFNQQQEQQKVSFNNQQFESSSLSVQSGFASVQTSNFESDKQNASIASQFISQQQQLQQQQFIGSTFHADKQSEPTNIQSALAALTKITAFGVEEHAEDKIPVTDSTDNTQSFLPLPYPYGKYANENLRAIVIEATNMEPPSNIKPETKTETTPATFKPLPYPYGPEINIDQKYPTQSNLNDQIVTSLIGGTTQESLDDKNKSIQSALAALTKITSLGSEYEPTSNLDTTTTSYEILPIGIGHQDQDKIDEEISESDLLKLYRYQEQKFNRQQEVMSSLVTAMDNPQLNSNLRTYSLYKNEQFFGYGIAFHTEDISISESYHKLVYPLIEIEPQSPADDAGMKNGQRVVAVNGEFVNKEFKTLEDVVQAIEDSYYSRNFTEITVLEPQFWDEFMESPALAAQLANFKPKQVTDAKTYVHQIIDSVIEKHSGDKSIPRLCRLSRESRADQYGFDFKTLKNEGKHVANNVRPDFPADKAGLRDGDYILEVNGESIDNIEHDSVVNKISAQPTQVDLLVVGDLNAYLTNRQQPVVKPSKVDVEIEPVEPIQPIVKRDDVSRHELKLIPEFNGLGISLASNGVISSIEPNSPAERAGLKKDNKIVEVNGIDVRNKSNKEIAKAIKENEKSLQIGVVKMAPKIDQLTSSTAELKPATDELRASRTDLSSVSSHKISESSAPITDARICNLVNRPDYDGFGFSMRGNEKGPHQISNVEKDSPAMYAGLRNDDLILKVNDINVVGERYNKTVALIKNESDKGRLKLEVIDPQSCSNEIRNVVLTPQSGYSTLNKPVRGSKSGSIDNLRSITAEIIASGSGRDTVRSVSQLPTDRQRTSSIDYDNRRPRPASTSDIDRAPNSTVRSNTSYGSQATFTSEIRPSNIGSTRSVSSNIGAYKPKFKRCNVKILPDFKGYGFAINSKVKPKFMIYTVDQNSPAYKANLRETDVIVQIDNKNIRKLKFEKVKQLLSESQANGQVEILAIDKEGYKYYKERKKKFSSKKLVTAENTEPFFTVTSGPETDRTRDRSSDNEESDRLRGQTEPASASSSRIQITVPTVVPTTSSENETTGTVLDNFDIIAVTVNRETDKPLGLSLSTAHNRSASRASSVSSSRKPDEEVILPIITSVDAGSPAAKSGLRANDLILEINGRSTTGQTNNTVGKWIRSSGDQIEFLVSREKMLTVVSNDSDVIIKENARRIAEEALEAAKLRVPQNEVDTTQRLSRRDSAALSNRSGNASQQGSPKVVHSEVRMSSSRLQQDATRDEIKPVEQSPKSQLRPRNQSEPSVLQNEENVTEPIRAGTSSTPLSKRSASSFNLPRDAPIPRLCRVRAYEEQLGFIVAGSRTNRGVFKVNDVTPNSPAAHSGLLNDDQIIEISGVNVESMTYNEVVDYIKERKQDDDLQLLVADRATYQWYKAKKIPISSQIVPKMQYIETLLKEELQADLINQTNSEKSVSSKRIKIPNNSGESVFITRKIYLSNKYVLEENKNNSLSKSTIVSASAMS